MPKVDGLQLLARNEGRRSLPGRSRVGDEVRAPGLSADGPPPREASTRIISTGTSRKRSSAFILASSWSPSTFGIMMSRSSRLGRSSSSLPMRPSPPGAVTTSVPVLLQDPGQRPHQRLIRRRRPGSWRRARHRIFSPRAARDRRLPPLTTSTVGETGSTAPERTAAVVAAPDGSTAR